MRVVQVSSAPGNEIDGNTQAKPPKLRFTKSFVRQLAPDLIGRYSVAKLKAYNDYRITTKWWRMVAVVVLFPMPVCGILILLNMIPLVSPSEGLGANYGFFIRTFVMNVLILTGSRWQRESLSGAKNSRKLDLLVLSILSPMLSIFTLIFCKMFGVFPLPFSPVLVIAISGTVSITTIFWLMKRFKRTHPARANSRVNVQAQNPKLNEILVAYKRIATLECAILLVYSGFNAAFRKLNGAAQLGFTCLLPFLKIALEVVARRITRSSIEDMSAETVVFIVELFHSLYVSICMGGATSILTSIALMAWDFIHMGYMVRQLQKKSSLLAHSKTRLSKLNPNVDLMTLCVEYSTTHQEKLKHSSSVRFFSSNGQPFKTIMGWGRCAPNEISRSRTAEGGLLCDSVSPVVDATKDAEQDSKSEKFIDDLELLKDMLRFMHMTESFILTEYIEVFVPMFYGKIRALRIVSVIVRTGAHCCLLHSSVLITLAVYTYVTFYSPNQQFFYGILEYNEHSMRLAVRNIVIYGSLEFGSLLIAQLLFKRRFGINVLSALAFVLETHFFNIQGKLLFMFILALNFTLIHYGMDFSFRFEYQTDV